MPTCGQITVREPPEDEPPSDGDQPTDGDTIAGIPRNQAIIGGAAVLLGLGALAASNRGNQ